MRTKTSTKPKPVVAETIDVPVVIKSLNVEPLELASIHGDMQGIAKKVNEIVEFINQLQ